ncbi:metallophosphoesterase family protein [Lysinibacillus agricola]|uniref:metallophosphoesterase family protein n=1 Tax=Lysinibacillus agricola TaxID=2590012 RepID=UPI003C26AD14
MKFLQISDIHFQYQNYQSDRLRQKFIEKIVELNSTEPIDAIFITGDIVHKGNKANDESVIFIKEIINSINLDVSKLYIIPGNHDLTRNGISTLILDGIFANQNPSEALDNVPIDAYKLLLNTHNVFFEVYQAIKGQSYTEENLHLVFENELYNIINLNTSLTCYKNGQEGNLLISKQKLNSVLNEHKDALLDSAKVNIAMGHHTLDCLRDDEKQNVINLFDDFNIDIYLAGHVHQPRYYFTNNSSEFPFIELTSGALFSDDYAKPGFMCLNLNLDNYECSGAFYIWNEEFNYWTINNQLGRRSIDGAIPFELSRLKKKDTSLIAQQEQSSIEPPIDEDEFKEFIIQFHNSIETRPAFVIDTDKKIELEEKFEKMRCSPTFVKDFEKSSRYFGNIDEIMNSTSYVSTDKKELVADVIIEHYLDIHTEHENGDKIFVHVLRSITQLYLNKFNGYTELKLKRYIRILISWSIFECNIFNDEKEVLLN